MTTQSQRSLAERAVEALGGAGVLRAGAAPPAAAPPAAEAAPALPVHPTISRDTLIAAGGHSLHSGRSRCAEEMSVIQQQVLRALRDVTADGGRCTRLVLVTSARPAEGKTFTALNLAAAIARHGSMPALLVDADGKQGSISTLLGCDEAEGLRDLARRPDLAPAAVVRPTEVARLRFVPAGTAPAAAPRPSASALSDAFHRIAAAFPDDLLIVDAPPVLATSDASAAAALAGQVLVVVRAEATQRSEVEAALDMLDACPTLQLVLNRASNSSSDSFGAYGYEAYGS